MAGKLKIIQFGLGPIGAQTVRYLLERDNIELEAAIDIDPDKVGLDVGELIGIGRPLGVKVSADAEQVLVDSAADLVILSTVSSFERLEEQLQLCIRHGKNVLSSCEELAYPWAQDRPRAQRLDDAARAAGVSILSTGVNPGFAMDALPLFLTSACRRVDSIRVERYQDAALRRLPFQRKIGAGLALDDFRRQVDAGLIRHVGFTQSLQMIAAALGWQLDSVEEQVKPMIAEQDLESPDLKVKRGEAAGVLQTVTGIMAGVPVLCLELQACLGHPAPKDSVRIEGDLPIYSEIRGGVNGDIATCAMLANAVPLVRRAQPGLKTMLDIGMSSWYSTCRTA